MIILLCVPAGPRCWVSIPGKYLSRSSILLMGKFCKLDPLMLTILRPVSFSCCGSMLAVTTTSDSWVFCAKTVMLKLHNKPASNKRIIVIFFAKVRRYGTWFLRKRIKLKHEKLLDLFMYCFFRV